MKQPGWSKLDAEFLERLRDLREILNDQPTESEPFTLPTGRTINRTVIPDGTEDELAFRRYARRSGQVVCNESHENITRCGSCGAQV